MLFDACCRSWLIDWWRDYMYLSWRLSVVINVSYFYQFKPTPKYVTSVGILGVGVPTGVSR